MNPIRQIARCALERLETRLDTAFGPTANPLKQLGALGWFYYWIVVASGVYVYICFDSGVTEAYASVEYMTHVQWYAAGIMRSLHRYASDALVAVMLVHLAREFVKDRYRGVRWFSWVTGVAIIWFVYASGISGYWLVWDELAQYVAIASSELLDALGIFGDPIARNFIHDATLSGRFFTLMVFIHIAVPLFLLFLLWIHTQRITRAKVNPPKALALGTLAMMLALALAKPASSQSPAQLSQVAAEVGLDWFYLTLYPLFDHIPLGGVWAMLLGGTLVMALAPWLPPRREQRPARVDLANCNGCSRCASDCPYSAITMVPRTDGHHYELQAQVDQALCIACGICAGACPTATPYRRRSELCAGIELPATPLATLREKTVAACEQLTGRARVLVYGCAHGPALHTLADARTASVSLPCVGALPPSFLDFLLARRHVDGILLAGCHPNDCHARFGIQWTEARLSATRAPELRGRVPRERIGTSWVGSDGLTELQRDVQSLQRRLEALGPLVRPARRRELNPHARGDDEGV